MARTPQVMFVPVYGLRLTKLVNFTVSIGRVVFVASDRIPSLRKRLGLKHPVSHYKKLIPYCKDELFGHADVYACLRTRRDWSDDIKPELNTIREAFHVLASNFASYERRQDACMSLSPVQFGEHSGDRTVFGEGEREIHISMNRQYVLGPQITDHWWSRSAKANHFINLQQIVIGRRKVTPLWRTTLVRAAALFGESFLAKDVATAFLRNMIALETLLTRQGDGFPDAIINRLVGLFGWLTREDTQPWDEYVSRLYKLRCSYVHDGHAGEVTGMDVHCADELLRNLLDNLCRNTKWIRSKSDLIRLAEECRARQVLKLKPRRPRSLQYSERRLTYDQTAELNNTFMWSW